MQNTPHGLLLQDDKLYTVLIVVLVIWAGIVLGLLLTNRRIRRLEKQQARK